VGCGRVHLASWAQAELPLAADLLAGNDDVRPDTPDLLRRALAVLPAQVYGRPRVRADAAYFDQSLAHAAVAQGCDCAIAAKRNTACWRAFAAIGEDTWSDARDMPGGQVAACDYTPVRWPQGSYCIVRRVKVSASRISADPRSRRRRTIPAGQLALALAVRPTTPGPARSSSRTSRPTTAPTSSGWKPGSAGAPATRWP